MNIRKPKRFKDDIRKTFTIYTLVPVIVLTLLSYSMSFFLLQKAITDQNTQINGSVSQKIDGILSDYMAKASEVSARENVAAFLNNGKSSTVIYEDLYKFINSMDVNSNFYVYDSTMKPMISNSAETPRYALADDVFNMGISKRMTDMPDQVVLSKETIDVTNRQVLSIGKAIVNNGRIIGYLTFDLNLEDISDIISNSLSINVVITNRYGNVISTTNALLTNKFGKLDEQYNNRTGFINSIDNSHYISRTDILDGTLSIYTITTIGYFIPMLIIVAIILYVLLVVLIAATYLSARQIADSKTRVIDEIISRIENVKNGDLDTQMNIHTEDEFQIIAESYNQMLTDIKKLIETNRQIARESVVSEIKQLESQFNPHFLFNALETVKYMCKTDPAAVSKIIVSLSALLRYSINNSISEVTLSEDMEYTMNYLLIQKYRFGSSFEYSIRMDDNVNDCIVPKLLVQPAIENAVKYGFENKKTLSVSIRAAIMANDLVIVIYDDGIGMTPDQLEKVTNIIKQDRNESVHIGLYNVNRRIQLMYGENYGIELRSEKDSGTVVRIMLPICRRDTSHD